MTDPFTIKEVFITLVTHSDSEALLKLYPTYKDILDDPYILRQIADAHKIPFEVTVYKKGIPSKKKLIESFFDLIFSMELRNPAKRLSSCLSKKKIMMIAIMEQDLNLVKDLLKEQTFTPDILSMIGETGNVQLIDFILSSYYQTRIKSSLIFIFAGLVKGHHNDLYHMYKFDEKYKDLPFGNFHYVNTAAAEAGNLEIFKELYDPSEEYYEIHFAALGDSQNIIDYIKSVNEFSRIDYMNLFDGYIQGGHTDRAKEIYAIIEDKLSLDLSQAISSGSIETLKFAMEINKELGKDFPEDEIIEAAHNEMMNESKIYFVKTHLRWRSTFLDAMLISDDLKGQIAFIKEFDPGLIEAKSIIDRINANTKANKCFGKWLELQLGLYW